MNDLLSIPNVVFSIFLIIPPVCCHLSALANFGEVHYSCSTASSPPLRHGALRFLPAIRDEDPDDAKSALGVAAEPVILRDEDPGDAESALGAAAEADAPG